MFDTGLAADGFCPDFLGDVTALSAADTDLPNESPPSDEFIDPVAGHGTFIAGVVERVAPGTPVVVDRVLSTFGVGDDAYIATVMNSLDPDDLPDIFNLSFSAYGENDEPPPMIAAAVANLIAHGKVVVASAGNSASCRKTFPAALPGVVSVGALGLFGPAPFTNFGPWVRASAPGVDVVSNYFDPDDPTTMPNDECGHPFTGWAAWSGTSFAAPAVVGALAARMIATQCTAVEAVRDVIDAPHLMRWPGLGTIVNV